MLQATGQARGPPSPHTWQHPSLSWSFLPAGFFLPGLIKAQTRDQQRDVTCHLSPLFSFWAQLSWGKLHMPGRSLAVHPASAGGAPGALRHQGSREQGAKESTKQLEKPPQWSGVSMPSWEVVALPSSNLSLPKAPSLPHHVYQGKKFSFSTKLCCRSSASHKSGGLGLIS